jgi:hypothetical protein
MVSSFVKWCAVQRVPLHVGAVPGRSTCHPQKTEQLLDRPPGARRATATAPPAARRSASFDKTYDGCSASRAARISR